MISHQDYPIKLKPVIKPLVPRSRISASLSRLPPQVLNSDINIDASGSRANFPVKNPNMAAHTSTSHRYDIGGGGGSHTVNTREEVTMQEEYLTDENYSGMIELYDDIRSRWRVLAESLLETEGVFRDFLEHQHGNHLSWRHSHTEMEKGRKEKETLVSDRESLLKSIELLKMELTDERTSRRAAESKQRKLQELLDVVREVLGDKTGTLTDEERERFQSALTNADQFKQEEHDIEERLKDMHVYRSSDADAINWDNISIDESFDDTADGGANGQATRRRRSRQSFAAAARARGRSNDTLMNPITEENVERTRVVTTKTVMEQRSTDHQLFGGLAGGSQLLSSKQSSKHEKMLTQQRRGNNMTTNDVVDALNGVPSQPHQMISAISMKKARVSQVPSKAISAAPVPSKGILAARSAAQAAAVQNRRQTSHRRMTRRRSRSQPMVGPVSHISAATSTSATSSSSTAGTSSVTSSTSSVSSTGGDTTTAAETDTLTESEVNNPRSRDATPTNSRAVHHSSTMTAKQPSKSGSRHRHHDAVPPATLPAKNSRHSTMFSTSKNNSSLLNDSASVVQQHRQVRFEKQQQQLQQQLQPPIVALSKRRSRSADESQRQAAALLLQQFDRAHVFVKRSLIKSDICVPCGKTIGFGGTAYKCSECRVVCHPRCRDLLTLACKPAIEQQNPKSSLLTSSASSSSKMRDIVGYDLSNFAPVVPPRIPALIINCLREIEQRGLRDEGLYRIPGVEHEVRELKQMFVKEGKVPDMSKVNDVNVLCSVVKRFVRELREPLITFALWNRFAEAARKVKSDRIGKESGWRDEVYQCLDELPAPNRDTLAYLMLHFQRVAEAPETLMNRDNLTVALAPGIIGNSRAQASSELCVKETSVQQAIMRCLFAVPADYWSTIVRIQSHRTLTSTLRDDESTHEVYYSAQRNGEQQQNSIANIVAGNLERNVTPQGGHRTTSVLSNNAAASNKAGGSISRNLRSVLTSNTSAAGGFGRGSAARQQNSNGPSQFESPMMRD